jgi:anhydro-N-acetylmuramic acid kinase
MKVYKVVGLMSGTSLDGLDLAYCHIWEKDDSWNFRLKETKSISYDPKIKAQLKEAIHLPADQLLILNNRYGKWLGQKTKEFINEFNLEVDFISSHGHTTHHQPDNGLTFQIGSGQHIANTSVHKVVCDFRTNDVALGGQGAPLVPIGDQLFFREYDFCLNLGGISNISFESKGKRIAYDIGLANMILNYITGKIKLSFDDRGQLARKGTLNQQMYDALNALKYYKLPFPKSTGYEWFLEKVVPIVELTKDSIENLLHTSVHHICEQISIQVEKHVHKEENIIFVTGGGALNDFLMETLKKKLKDSANIVQSNNELIEYKEALVFGLMGVLRMENKTNVLSSVTGAKSDSSSGVIFLPN